MNTEFAEYLILAIGGYFCHLLKQYLQSINRNEEFINKKLKVTIALNLIAIPLLVYVAPTLPPELFVMSPISAIVIGWFNSSLLAGLINVKKPKLSDSKSKEDKP